MHHGLALLSESSPASLEEAVRSFDRALALRRALPGADGPQFRYARAAGWINRGDALVRLGTRARRTEAVASYDEALALLCSLPRDDDPLYPRRLAIAWINRGFAGEKASADAFRCFREALAVLDDASSAGIPDRDLLRAGALLNLAGALLDLGDPPTAQARWAAHRARALVGETERSDPAAAEVGLKARHVLCRALAAESHDGKSLPPDLAAEARQAVDEGLALVRQTQRRGATGWRALGEDLFRFGCRLCAAAVLPEFIAGNLDPERVESPLPPDPELHAAAAAALWNALEEIQRDSFRHLATPRFGQVLENLRELRVTEERVARWRQPAVACGPHGSASEIGREEKRC
jgi:tetratricopeptide (TPR) repeat protein